MRQTDKAVTGRFPRDPRTFPQTARSRAKDKANRSRAKLFSDLFMIRRARVNHESAVHLFAQHHAHELMRQRHIRKGQSAIGTLFHPCRQPARRADKKGDLFSRVRLFFNQRGEFFAGKFFSFHGERDHVSAAGGKNFIRFFFYRRFFGKFPDFHGGEPRQPFRILRHGFAPETFL